MGGVGEGLNAVPWMVPRMATVRVAWMVAVRAIRGSASFCRRLLRKSASASVSQRIYNGAGSPGTARSSGGL